MGASIIPIAAAVRTTCPYCGVGCGVKATPMADGALIEGDPDHMASRGRLCVKGSALGETLGLDGRLLRPAIREGGHLRDAGWDEAIGTVASRFAAIIAEHGPDAVAMYVSGQLLTEDYYVANKFMKGYVGSANIDTNSRLCMSSSVAGHKRAFGEDLVPGCYEDFELADMIVLVGSNTAWCHPTLFQRITRAKELRPSLRIVAIDPRRTATCELADLHLPVKAGTDVWLFNGLLSYLARHGAANEAFVAAHTAGLDAALLEADGCADIDVVARTCGIDPRKLLEFYEAFAATGKVVTAFSQGVNQSSAGTDKVNSIINCHLLTGRIGQPGMGPFSLTGQPNAMGGREVGGLANMLAAHLELDQPAHREAVRGFWDAPRIADKPGLKAVDLFRAIEAGTVKAVWIMATNPVVSLPDADQVKRALARCELVVVSDVSGATDTAAFGHVLLPALGWGEKDGTVTNSERCISRQRGFLPSPGEARADWEAICQVAQRMGFQGFDYEGAHEIFDEHARLSAWKSSEAELARAFRLDGLVGMGREAYDALEPVQWPVLRGREGTPRLFGDGRFSHPGGKARFVTTAPRAPVHKTGGEFPLALNTGRLRDQWHTMTRTGKSPRLAGHSPEPFVDLHPHDALLAGVKEGELARVSSRWGAVVARVAHSGGIARGAAFVPIHWNGQTASDARVGAVVNPEVDPVSGEPEFKHTPVRVEPFGVAWHGFVLSRDELDLEAVANWTRVCGAGFVRYELAGREAVTPERARALLRATEESEWIEYEDKTEGMLRCALLVDGRLQACLFMARRPDLPSRAWLGSLFAEGVLSVKDRATLLAGRAPAQGADPGPTVCSCFGVGRNTICKAIAEHGLTDAAGVTACVRAGGNCGSCLPEIRQLLVVVRESLSVAH
ncbi:nitrate reductase [Massilia yuzhufengensis]|uniref:Assimilatory nitrate reductase (NADH) alpha subunit apoprotein n=1 Tax=Massilia yuzhufengensis TaxID=1164594 RepID=A0A1I1FRB7_9BURK|nr:nitrate reductase [Massilia yuzhufengensis]SFC01987.1 assimilatory nitrate reductase (NADH) alpha subunit apoprotein [Massilia yuzhufengensis]